MSIREIEKVLEAYHWPTLSGMIMIEPAYVAALLEYAKAVEAWMDVEEEIIQAEKWARSSIPLADEEMAALRRYQKAKKELGI